jgi:hypothetical protein
MSKYAVLRRDFAFVGEDGIPHIATIGFPFNGISTPRPVWAFTGSPWGEYMADAVVHDHLCALCEAMPPGDERDWQRAIADDVFRDGLDCLGAGRVTQWTWYACVRAHALTVGRRGRMPNYQEHLEQYYQALGIADVYDWVQDRILRHS